MCWKPRWCSDARVQQQNVLQRASGSWGTSQVLLAIPRNQDIYRRFFYKIKTIKNAKDVVWHSNVDRTPESIVCIARQWCISPAPPLLRAKISNANKAPPPTGSSRKPPHQHTTLCALSRHLAFLVQIIPSTGVGDLLSRKSQEHISTWTWKRTSISTVGPGKPRLLRAPQTTNMLTWNP